MSNCKMTDEYCLHDKTNYDILKEYEAHGVPVSSYDSWQKHKKVTAETQIKNCDLEIINKQLKELLKECFEYIDWTDGTGSPISQQKLLDKIDEVLK